MSTTFKRRPAAGTAAPQSELPLTERTYPSPLTTQPPGKEKEEEEDQLSVRRNDSDVSVALQGLTNT